MIDLGMVRPGVTLNIPFGTYDSNDPSASVTCTGLAVTDIEIYKDGSLTQRASDSGYAVDIDLDTITGVHSIQIDLADNTTAGFFAAGSEYVVVVSSITVDAATVSFVAARFSIGYPGAIINTTIATLASQTSFTLTKGPAEADALNGMWCIIHDVASEVQLGYAVITDYAVTTKTVTLAAGTSFSAAAGDNISIMGPAPLQPTTAGRSLDVTATGAAGIDWGNVENKTTANDLSGTDIQLVDTCTTNTDMVSEPPTAAAVADQVWDEAAAGHVAAGSFGAQCGTDIDAILSDTGTDGVVVAAASKTGYDLNADQSGVTIGTVSTLTGHTAQTGDSFARIGAPAGASVSADVAAVKSDTAAVRTDTGTTIPGVLGTPAGADMSADIADVKTDTGTTIPAAITALQADLPVKFTKNVAFTNFMFKMVDATDGYTAETGITVTATRALDGAAFAACANSVVEMSDGWYKINLDATDLNANMVVLRFTGTGCRATEIPFITQAT